MHGQLTGIIFFILVFSGTVSADCRYQSPAHRVALLELYTSEGCSSCPPADRWLSALRNQGLDEEKVVPLSLHVDYWNYIGWRDPYSKSRYTQRQRKIARQNGLSTIYTPQLVLQGRDFRAWRGVNISRLLAAVNSTPAQADIALRIAPQAGRDYSVTVAASLKNASSGRLFVAIYENQLSSNVTAGENDGRLLRHDHVVRQLYGPVPLNETPANQPVFSRHLQLPEQWRVEQLGVAAFVEQDDGEILQAMAKPLSCHN